MRNHFRNAIFALGFSTVIMLGSCVPAPAFAQDVGDMDICDSIALSARVTMIARQQGRPMSEAIRNAELSNAMHLTQMIHDAYDYPVVKGEREKYYAGYRFERLYYLSCVKVMVQYRAK